MLNETRGRSQEQWYVWGRGWGITCPSPRTKGGEGREEGKRRLKWPVGGEGGVRQGILRGFPGGG